MLYHCRQYIKVPLSFVRYFSFPFVSGWTGVFEYSLTTATLPVQTYVTTTPLYMIASDRSLTEVLACLLCFRSRAVRGAYCHRRVPNPNTFACLVLPAAHGHIGVHDFRRLPFGQLGNRSRCAAL